MTIRSMINRAGMPILQNFSMPSATPAATMNTLSRDKQRGPEDHLAAVEDELAEELGDISNVPGVPAEDSGQVAESVAHDHAAEDEVKAEDQERYQNCHVTHPGELLAELAISRNRAHPGLTTNGKFANHNGEADQYRKNEVNEQEGRSRRSYPSCTGSPKCCPRPTAEPTAAIRKPKLEPKEARLFSITFSP